MPKQEQEQKKFDPEIIDAVREEQEALDEHMQQQQVLFLMNRCVNYNVRLRHMSEAQAAVGETPSAEDAPKEQPPE